MKISFDHQLCLLFSVACMRKWPINQRKNNRPITISFIIFIQLMYNKTDHLQSGLCLLDVWCLLGLVQPCFPFISKAPFTQVVYTL